MTADEMRAVWAAHCQYEFDLRDVEGALSTMTDDPYVWNIPTLRGGRGREAVRRFYRDEFVGTLPADAKVSSRSLTLGDTQLAEEISMSFTHDRLMPWILPGVERTGRRVEIPQLAVVAFENGKIAHEHIWWDQASVLVQVGLLDASGLPVFGVETARQLASLPPDS